MKFSQTQYIRFPSVMKLHFTGSEARKTFYNKLSHPITSRQPNDLKTQKQKFTQIKEFKIITVPQQNCLITISSMQKPNTPKKEEIYRQSTADDDPKLNTRSKSLTGINFHVKKKVEKSKPLIKINYSELYAQSMQLFALSYRVALKKSNLNIRIRRAKVQKGNNDYLIKQIIKGRSWWTTLNRMTEQEGQVFKSINMNLVNLNWTQNNIAKIGEDSAIGSAEAFRLRQNSQQISGQQLVSFQRSFDKMILQAPKMLQLFFTQWQQKPVKINEWIEKMPIDYITVPQKLIIYNHLKNHQCMSNKKNLYQSLMIYYDKTYKNAFDKIPKTYHLTAYNWQHILHFIKKQDKAKSWLIKPGQNSNQGRGIQVMKTTKQLIDKILLHPPKSQESTLIVQEYIKPMLYDQRKFDIRCYMLAIQVKKSIKFYWYDQGYIRTATKKFTLNKLSKSIHLTNDAIQKKFSNYGQRETANKLSYSQLQKYILEAHNIDFYNKVLPEMRSVCRDLCEAVSHQIGCRQGINFEIFGLDYLIDENGKPWLIQVNTNPSYDLNCNLLTRIIPQMLENTFRLVLDVFLPNARGQPDYAQFFINSNKYRLLHSNYRSSNES